MQEIIKPYDPTTGGSTINCGVGPVANCCPGTSLPY